MPTLTKLLGLAVLLSASFVAATSVTAQEIAPSIERYSSDEDVSEEPTSEMTSEALEGLIRMSAASGKPEAQTQLACMLYAKQSDDAATEAGMLLAKAASQGDAEAMVYLAKMLLDGGGRNGPAYAAQLIDAVFVQIRAGRYRLVPGEDARVILDPEVNAPPTREVGEMAWSWISSTECGADQTDWAMQEGLVPFVEEEPQAAEEVACTAETCANAT